MTCSVPKVLVPTAFTDAMVISSTVAEPSASETAWASGGTYAVGDRRIRTTTHREYECSAAHTGITTPPENDPTRWFEIGPTDKWAMFDNTCSTQTATTTTLTVVMKPGFFNAIALYKLTGSTIAVTVKDAPGGSTIFSYSGSLVGPFVDEWDAFWGSHRERSKLVLSGITPYPEAELTITVSASTGVAVGIGMICVGDLRPLLMGDWGGIQAGARAEPVDFSYIKTDEFGNTQIIKRRNATDLRISIAMPRSDADAALASVQEVLAVPAAWVGTETQGFDGLNVFGLGSGSLSYDSESRVTLDLTVKGLV